jgi:NADH dehydrogenase [ubiquinone] 1 alpha subcomplex assembly factor 6
MNRAYDYVRDLVQKHDHDRYLLSLFAPADARPALWALFALNYEIAKTRDVVSDTNLGLIRLQWWRDEIAKIYAGEACGQNQVLSTVAQAIQKYDLPKELFETLIYAREFDLEDVAPANMDGLKHYADFTNTPLNKMMLKIAGETASDEEIRNISVNYAVIGLLRSVPYMLMNRRCFLPELLLKEKNLSPQKLFDYNHKGEIVDVVKEIAVTIDAYRKPKSKLLKIQQKMSSIYLKQMQKDAFDVFSASVQSEPPFFALRLALSPF